MKAAKNVFCLILAFICKVVIFIFGWTTLDKVLISKINKNKRTIVVFSHTSYVDFFVLIIYLLAYKDGLKEIRTLVKPQPFEYAGNILKRLGCIPSTKIEDNNGGAINRITSELEQLDNFAFLISPKGTIVNKPWKKGYYYISKNLDANIMVAGFDYELKQICIFDDYRCKDYEEDEIRCILQQDIAKIVPLFPEDEVIKIREHNEDLRGIINWHWTSKVIATIVLVKILLIG